MVIILLLFASARLYAQSLTIDNMITKSGCLNEDCFIDISIGLGFVMYSEKETDEYTCYQYSKDEDPDEDSKNDYIELLSVTIYKNGKSTFLSYETSNEIYFGSLIEQLKLKGFSLTSKVKGENGATELWKSAQLQAVKVAIKNTYYPDDQVRHWNHLIMVYRM